MDESCSNHSNLTHRKHRKILDGDAIGKTLATVAKLASNVQRKSADAVPLRCLQIWLILPSLSRDLAGNIPLKFVRILISTSSMHIFGPVLILPIPYYSNQVRTHIIQILVPCPEWLRNKFCETNANLFLLLGEEVRTSKLYNKDQE